MAGDIVNSHLATLYILYWPSIQTIFLPRTGGNGSKNGMSSLRKSTPLSQCLLQQPV